MSDIYRKLLEEYRKRPFYIRFWDDITFRISYHPIYFFFKRCFKLVWHKRYYKNYIGQYVKRFYSPFNKKHVSLIKDFRINKHGYEEYLYSDESGDYWLDCEDSCIITNELPIKDIDWVANVNSSEYEGYNPFKG